MEAFKGKYTILTESHNLLIKYNMKTIKEIMNDNTRIGKPTTNCFVIVCHRKLSMSEHRMDGVRSPAKAKDFPSSLCAQTRSEIYSAFNPMSTGGPFPGAKARQRRDADHSPPSNADFKNEYELCFLSPYCLHDM
jgi:hypothetical protein